MKTTRHKEEETSIAQNVKSEIIVFGRGFGISATPEKITAKMEPK